MAVRNSMTQKNKTNPIKHRSRPQVLGEVETKGWIKRHSKSTPEELELKPALINKAISLHTEATIKT